MHKALILISVLLFLENTIVAQVPPPPEPDEFADLELFESVESVDLNDMPDPPADEKDYSHLPAEPSEITDADNSANEDAVEVSDGGRWEVEPHQQVAFQSDRAKPFRHLAQMPGQYRGDPIHLLRMKFVRNEIELTSEQKVSIHNAEKEYRNRVREVLSDRNQINESPDSNAVPHGEIHEELAQLRSDTASEIQAEILLPDQVQRLKEIDFQMKVMSQGVVEAIKDESLGLDVRQEQVESIDKRAGELVEEYKSLVRSFKIDFQEKILKELDPDQRSKIESMMGESFQLMDDEADEQLADSVRSKENALGQLEKWRRRSQESGH